MKIARITELNKGFLIIFEDGTELKLSEEVYFTNSVYEKEEMSQEDIDKLLFKENVTDGLIKCRRYIAGGLKPERRLFAYLEDNGFSKEESTEIIRTLREEEYIDDMKFALKRIKRKMAASPVSSRMMVDYLENEGVGREIAEAAVRNSKLDDMKTAGMLAKKKLKATKGNKRKTAVYLASKGFGEETVMEVLGMEELWNG